MASHADSPTKRPTQGLLWEEVQSNGQSSPQAFNPQATCRSGAGAPTFRQTSGPLAQTLQSKPPKVRVTVPQTQRATTCTKDGPTINSMCVALPYVPAQRCYFHITAPCFGIHSLAVQDISIALPQPHPIFILPYPTSHCHSPDLYPT